MDANTGAAGKTAIGGAIALNFAGTATNATIGSLDAEAVHAGKSNVKADGTVLGSAGSRHNVALEHRDAEVFAINYQEQQLLIKRWIADICAWWLQFDNPDKVSSPSKRSEGKYCIMLGKAVIKESYRI